MGAAASIVGAAASIACLRKKGEYLTEGKGISQRDNSILGNYMNMAMQYFYDEETEKHHQFVDLRESEHSKKVMPGHIKVISDDLSEQMRLAKAIAKDINEQKNPKHKSHVVKP